MSLVGMDRRQFIGLFGAAAAAAVWEPSAFAEDKAPDFSFIFLTDTHIQPELDATHGVELAMKQARGIKADFAIQGGDHVFDALGVPKQRATSVFDLYGKTEQDLGIKVHHTIGNHDVFGVYTASGATPSDPEYGKKMFMERFGPTYYSFDHKGVHFIVLDSIGITADHHYEARMDDDQLAWLGKDLAAQGATKPVIVVTHIPLVTAVPSYTPPAPQAASGTGFTNGPAAIKLFEGNNVLAVLQGHTHVNERVDWHGVPYITSGAVCGNWWHGTRLGTPEGFTVVTVAGNKLTTRYETTGFKSVAPQNT
jgi:3',5'-cyclic AMP phosphodiesterase CpdA